MRRVWVRLMRAFCLPWKALVYGPLDHLYDPRISEARIVIYAKVRADPKNPFKKERLLTAMVKIKNKITSFQNLHRTGMLKQAHIQLRAY